MNALTQDTKTRQRWRHAKEVTHTQTHVYTERYEGRERERHRNKPKRTQKHRRSDPGSQLIQNCIERAELLAVNRQPDHRRGRAPRTDKSAEDQHRIKKMKIFRKS
eukprot:1157260-Pyramimonas_sp.AAC.1